MGENSCSNVLRQGVRQVYDFSDYFGKRALLCRIELYPMIGVDFL